MADRDPGAVTALDELELIYRTAPVGLCSIDRDLRFVRINERLAAINGRPVQEHIGKTLREIIPEIADTIEPIYRRIIATGEPARNLEVAGLTNSEPREQAVWLVNYFPVLHEGEVIGVNSVVQDITARKRNEEKLRRQAQILEQIHDAVVATDMESAVRFWNTAAEKLFGYTRDEALGRSVFELVVFPEDRSSLEPSILEPLKRKGTHEITVRHRNKSGVAIVVDLRLSLFRDENGASIGMIGCANDITRTRALQEELAHATTREQRRIGQELHDGTGQELTGLSCAARSLATSLREAHPAGAEQAEAIAEGLRRALVHVRDLARGLLPVEIDAGGLMFALQSLASRIDGLDGMACSFSCDAAVPVPDNETATHLFRIAQEATTNAIKHGRADNVRIQLACVDSSLRLRIVDDGVGLADPSGSDGLGLGIMAFRAEMIGGRLNVGAAEGGGTEVVCVVPQEDDRGG